MEQMPYDMMETSANVDDREIDSMGPIAPGEDPLPEYSKAVLNISTEKKEWLAQWLEKWINDLLAMQANKLVEFKQIEVAYRAAKGEATEYPFVGACRDTIPVVAMAVEPVQARIETGIFKQDPVFRAKPIRKSAKKYSKALETWFNFYFRQILDFQRTAAPRIHECAKLGTMVFKVSHVVEKCKYRTYDEQNNIREYEHVKFRGPRPEGVELGDFLFPPSYQHLQDCPIVAERQRTTLQNLRALETQGYLADVDKLKGAERSQRNDLEIQRETEANHETLDPSAEDVLVYECWFKVQLPGDQYVQSYVATFCPDTRTFLQLRLNPYFHQQYPYVLIPYSIASQSLYGIGIGEMSIAFQESVTSLHRNAVDNSYIANTRMWARKAGSRNSEDRLRVYAGKVHHLDDPKNDLIPLQMGDSYQSTLQERQNLFGMVEKRTGVSDYMTGRESPALGSRATATSTLALIQEGTRRVEQVMENIRRGLNEIARFCMMLWAQYGLGDVDDYMFSDEQTGALLDEFFKNIVRPENIETLLLMDVGVTDATTNRQIQQQMQMQLIQTMTGYLSQLVQAGQLAVQAKTQAPELAELISEVVSAGQKMYTDLLSKYDLPAAEDYLPNVEAIFESLATPVDQGAGGGVAGAAQGAPNNAGMGVPGGGMPGQEGGSNPGLEQLLAVLGGNAAAAGAPA